MLQLIQIISTFVIGGAVTWGEFAIWDCHKSHPESSDWFAMGLVLVIGLSGLALIWLTLPLCWQTI